MMRMVILLAIEFFFTCTFFGQTERSAKAELPKDLLIQLSAVSRGRPDPGYSYSITINSDGTWFYEGFRGFHVGRFTGPELGRANEERLKKLGKSGSKMPVERLTEADLIDLVEEFKSINFLELDEKYSFGQIDPKTGEVLGCLLHTPTETIYFRANERTKTVENFTGCHSPINAKLTALGEKIRNKLNFK